MNIPEQGVTLVDFWKPSCAPCRMMMPAFDLTKQKLSNVNFEKVNVEENYDATKQYDIKMVPTFILFKDGKEVERRFGAFSQMALENWVTSKIDNP